MDAPPAVVKPPMYRSRHNPKPPTASCFGLENTTRVPGANRGDSGNTAGSNCDEEKINHGGRTKTRSNPRDYLKGSGKDIYQQKCPSEVCKTHGASKSWAATEVRETGDGIANHQNFLVANAVENILAVPKKVDHDEPLYVAKKDRGQVPEYLSQVKAAIQEEKAVLRGSIWKRSKKIWRLRNQWNCQKQKRKHC